MGFCQVLEVVTSEEATRLALRSDWEKIGNDLRRAMDKMDEDLKQQGITPPNRKK